MIEHRNRYQRKREEKELEARRERVRKAQEANKKAAEEAKVVCFINFRVTLTNKYWNDIMTQAKEAEDDDMMGDDMAGGMPDMEGMAGGIPGMAGGMPGMEGAGGMPGMAGLADLINDPEMLNLMQVIITTLYLCFYDQISYGDYWVFLYRFGDEF